MADKVVVVGLGRFGTALSSALARMGYDVLAVDRSADRVKELAAEGVRAVQGDATSRILWDDLDVKEFHVGVVAFSSSVEASILACLTLKRAGIPYLIAKSTGDLHTEVLAAVGVQQVVQPEQETGKRLAHVLGAAVSEYIELGDDYGIAKLASPASLVGLTCADIQQRLRASVLAVRRGDRVILSPSAKEEIRAADVLFLAASDGTLRGLATEKSHGT